MPADIIAALGVAFLQGKLLQKTVSKAIQETLLFRSNLKRLKTTLHSLISMVKEIRELCKRCDDAPSKPSILDKLTRLLKNGRKLVDKCRDSWNFFKWSSYSTKLTKLNDDLLRFCQMDLQLEQWKGNKLNFLQMKEINKKLDAQKKQLERNTMGNTNILVDASPCLAALAIAAIAAWVVLKFLPLVVRQFNLATVALWVAIFIAACGFPASFAVLSIGIVACVGLQFNLAAVLPWLAISMFRLIDERKETFSDDFLDENLLGGLSVLSIAAIAVWVVLKLLLSVGLEFNFATVASWVDISIAALVFRPALAVRSIGIVACVGGLQFNFATVVPWVAICIIILIRSQKESMSLGAKEESASCTKKKNMRRKVKVSLKGH